MLHQLHPSGESDIRKSLIYLLFLMIAFASMQCSDKGPTSIIEPYTPPDLNSTWETITTPETVGWSSVRLQKAYIYSQSIRTAAVMIVYQGKVLYHWGETSQKFWVHSCRKSFLSALIGIHVDAGNINLSKTMAELGIDDNAPSLSDLEKTATVRMLLQARSGIYHPAAAESAGMKALRPARYSHAPGTFWYYNNWDFNVLGTIFEQETGTKIFEELKHRIADPIGMEDFEVSDGLYQFEPVSIHPAYPFRMTARDMARLGLLFLHNGVWQGKRIISDAWIKASITSYSDAGSAGGYGYMWWVVVGGKHLPLVNLSDGSYSARGYNGHFIVVIPDMDLVVVHRVNTDIDNAVTDTEFGILLGLILDAKES